MFFELTLHRQQQQHGFKPGGGGGHRWAQGLVKHDAMPK
jgi:hypothetical protein